MSTGTATSGMLEVALAPRRSLSPLDAPDRGRHSRRSLTPGDAAERGGRSRSASPYGDLSSKVALFNKQASDHMQAQAVNPFSGDGRASPRPRLDKSDASYGRPVGKTALRGLKAQSQVSKEILELCEVIAENGESLSDGPGDDDPRVAISFGHLFHIYTYISNKVVGILLRGRKQKLLEFEGETLFQKRDDHVPIIMLKPIQEIREIFRSAEQKERELRKQQERELYLQEHPEVLIEEEMRRAYEEEMAEQQQQQQQQQQEQQEQQKQQQEQQQQEQQQQQQEQEQKQEHQQQKEQMQEHQQQKEQKQEHQQQKEQKEQKQEHQQLKEQKEQQQQDEVDRRSEDAAELPKPVVEFQLRVTDESSPDDGATPADAITSSSGSAGDGDERQEQPDQVGAVEPTPPAEQTLPERLVEGRGPESQLDEIPAAEDPREDLKHTTPTNPEESKEQERVC